VRIGYLLKVARDTRILEASPYRNMEEFAQAEFHIDKGTASKFVGINDRFSEGGYSEHLKPEYQGIGWSKLSIMLQLPDAINEEISRDFSKSDIQELRGEIAEAEKVTPVETMLEGESSATAAVETMLDKAVRQLGESEPGLYVKIHNMFKRVGMYKKETLREIKLILAPSGENMYSIRIRGVGRILLSLKGDKDTVAVVNERTGEKESGSWEALTDSWAVIMNLDQMPGENWEAVYGRQFPEIAGVAPVQPKKVTKVNQKQDRQKPKKPEKPSVEEPSTEPQIPGQDSIEKHPEWMPGEEVPEGYGEPAGQEPEAAAGSTAGMDRTAAGYKAAISGNIRQLQTLWERSDGRKFSLMLTVVRDMERRLEKLVEIGE
jgi:hypothetical protein